MRKEEYPEILKLSAVTYGKYNQQEIDVIIQRFTSFDRRKRPCKEDFPKIRRKLFYLSKIMGNTHLCSEFKRRKAVHKKDKEYFVDSMNILGNCYFEQNRFADCIEVLQEICTQDYISYFVIFIKKFQNIKRIRINAMKKLWQFKKKQIFMVFLWILILKKIKRFQ